MAASRYGVSNIIANETELAQKSMHKAKLETVHQQLETWGTKNAEILKSLRELQMGVRSAAEVVRESVNAAKAYPVDTVDHVSRRLEACAARCEESAKKAQTVYEAARKVTDRAGRNGLLHIMATSLFSSAATAIALVIIF